MSRRVKHKSFPLMAVLTPLLLIFLIGECSLRLFFQKEAQKHLAYLSSRKTNGSEGSDNLFGSLLTRNFVLHPYLGFTMRSNIHSNWTFTEFQTDQNGFRNDEHFDFRQFLRGPNSKDKLIGVFGGSTLFGVGINGNEHTLPQVMNGLIKAKYPSASIKVINFGIPGWRYPQQFILAAQIIQHLDYIVTLDGFNEIFISIVNQIGDGERLPPDYPFSDIYGPLINSLAYKDSITMKLSEELDRNFSETSSLAHSKFFNWIRYSASLALRKFNLNRFNSGNPEDIYHTSFQNNSVVVNSVQLDSFGINEHVKYSDLMDGLATRNSIGILHVLQPFLFAKKETGWDTVCGGEEWCSNWKTMLTVNNNHPSYYYGRMRSAFRRHYHDAKKSKGIWAIDLSEDIPLEKENWTDFVHLSSDGTKILAQTIFDFLDKNGVIKTLSQSR